MALEHNTQTPDIETASPDYRRRFAGAIGAYFLEVQREAVLDCLRRVGESPLKILDLGGGHAQVTEALLQAGHEVIVHGSDSSCFEYVLPLRSQYPGRLSCVTSSLWSVPCEHAAFDVVIALRLLAHIERRKELFAEMSRLASRALLFDFPALKALNALSPALFSVKRNIEGNTRPYFSYREEELRDELEALGFSAFYSRKQFFLPMGVHRALKMRVVSGALEGALSSVGLTKRFGSPVLMLAQRSPAK